MRKILKDNCDFICKIPINKQIESLNVYNAAAISLSVLVEKRKAII